MKKESVFFPGINSLRFFAALAVIITHIELLKSVFGFTNCWRNTLIFNLGGLGVYFFFVLSGFLITFLLLKEKEKNNTINIKAFYIRRILRIWPLYYFVLVLGFFILPHFIQLQIPYLQRGFEQHYVSNLLLYTFILPNVAFSFYTAVPHIGQAWSIGVEEQFYIIWPWIISKTKNVIKSLALIILVLFFIKTFVLILGNFYGNKSWYLPLKTLLAMSKFECMAIGGIGAYYLHQQKQSFLKIIYNPTILNCSILLIPMLIYFTPDKIQNGVHIVFSFIFLIIIMNVAGNKKIWLNLENRYFSYLGKISFGIYMYHFMLIPIILYLYTYFDLKLDEFNFNLLIYSGSIGITIFVSGISFYVFENKFIRLKSKYAIIKSGDKEAD